MTVFLHPRSTMPHQHRLSLIYQDKIVVYTDDLSFLPVTCRLETLTAQNVGIADLGRLLLFVNNRNRTENSLALLGSIVEGLGMRDNYRQRRGSRNNFVITDGSHIHLPEYSMRMNRSHIQQQTIAGIVLINPHISNSNGASISRMVNLFNGCNTHIELPLRKNGACAILNGMLQDPFISASDFKKSVRLSGIPEEYKFSECPRSDNIVLAPFGKLPRIHR
jgi:hypothetical protein